MEIQFNEKRRSLAESRQLRVEEVPEYKVKTPTSAGGPDIETAPGHHVRQCPRLTNRFQ